MATELEQLSYVVLPRRVVPQPTPNLNAGGDCGPCVLSGILGTTPAEIYERHFAGKPTHLNHHEMARLLRVELDAGRLDRCIENAANWTTYSGQQIWQATYGYPSWFMHDAWFAYVQMGMDAGYYGLAEVDYAKTGGEKYGGPDHWVMLCGAVSYIRWNLDEHGHRKCGTFVKQVLVSCSARGSKFEEWVDSKDFLKFRGGFDCLLARPAP